MSIVNSSFTALEIIQPPSRSFFDLRSITTACSITLIQALASRGGPEDDLGIRRSSRT